MRQKSALIIIDFQNDFCSPRGKGAERRGDQSRLKGTARNIGRALGLARDGGMEVLFVQFIGDRKYQNRNMRDRDRRLGKNPKCLEGTWGADFFQIAPRTSETIVKKYACFDPFFNPALDAHLRKKKISRLVLAGVYLDICLDSTARTAFQKGYDLSVLRDCTESLHYAKEDVLAFMAKYYGANIALSRDFIGRIRSDRFH